MRYRDACKSGKALIAMHFQCPLAEGFGGCAGYVIYQTIYVCEKADIRLRVLCLKAFDRTLPAPDMTRFAVLLYQPVHLWTGIRRYSLDIAPYQPLWLLAQAHVTESYQRVLYPCVNIIFAALQLQ